MTTKKATTGRPLGLTEAEQQLVRAWSQLNIPLAEQARRLKRPQSNLMQFRKQLSAEGVIARRARPPWQPWTPADDHELERRLEAGETYTEIGRAMKRTTNSIQIRAKRMHYTMHGVPTVLNSSQVAQLLGLRCAKKVADWIERR